MQRLLISVPVLVGSLVWLIRANVRLTKHRKAKASFPEKLKNPPKEAPITVYLALNDVRYGLSYLREYFKWTLRSWFSPRLTQRWMSFWNSTPWLTKVAISEPSVLKKIYRPYMTNLLSVEDRFNVLTSHYTMIDLHGLNDIVLRAANLFVQLSQFSGKSGTEYQIRLVVDNQMEREGELVLQLLSNETLLFSVAFTFFNHTGPSTVAIGCLQGGRAVDSLEKIRFATRDMFGLRPKTLMVRLVQQIGHQMECSDLLLVGNQNRTVRNQLRKGIVFADYDATWEELGALRRNDGDFKLKCSVLTEPDFQLLASSKRSEAKKRFALLSTIAQRTCEGFLLPHNNSPLK